MRVILFAPWLRYPPERRQPAAVVCLARDKNPLPQGRRFFSLQASKGKGCGLQMGCRPSMAADDAPGRPAGSKTGWDYIALVWGRAIKNALVPQHNCCRDKSLSSCGATRLDAYCVLSTHTDMCRHFLTKRLLRRPYSEFLSVCPRGAIHCLIPYRFSPLAALFDVLPAATSPTHRFLLHAL